MVDARAQVELLPHRKDAVGVDGPLRASFEIGEHHVVEGELTCEGPCAIDGAGVASVHVGRDHLHGALSEGAGGQGPFRREGHIEGHHLASHAH